MNKTKKNLENAFSGESQANRRYLAFAKKAEEEGYSQAAKLFKAAAEAETVHALNHLQITGNINSTAENLKTAISGETFEFTNMYPEYIATANEEENKQALWSFNVANKVEKIHAVLFKKAISNLEKGQKLEKVDYYVCSVCGNTVESLPPDKCPVCNAPKEKFLKPT
ncbi:rubrerythrin family protein [Candidatus Bathyarchaeota archaeon]|nr:rubrerythrin family protein [Candidatus Bathyarchaeota archaeon]MCJ7713539.1 rubrerythrin family protein [Candidatus Bathyarchaeota archaeon]